MNLAHDRYLTRRTRCSSVFERFCPMLAARRKGGRRSMSPSESDETCPSTCWEAGFVVIQSVTSGSPAMSGPERASRHPAVSDPQRPRTTGRIKGNQRR